MLGFAHACFHGTDGCAIVGGGGGDDAIDNEVFEDFAWIITVHVFAVLSVQDGSGFDAGQDDAAEHGPCKGLGVVCGAEQFMDGALEEADAIGGEEVWHGGYDVRVTGK